MKEYRELIDKVQQLAQANPDNDAHFIQGLLEQLTHHGFSSTRFYEVVRDPIENDEVLVLRMAAPASSLIGLRIPLRSSTLGAAGSKQDVVSGAPETSPDRAQGWITQLGLEKSHWVDIAVRDSKGMLSGLIAVAAEDSFEFEDEDKFYLGIVKDRVVQYEAQRQIRQLQAPKEHIADFFRQVPAGTIGATEIAELAARVILEASGGEACAVFFYDWATRTLTKVAEALEDSHVTGKIQERYFSGQFLTGKAWEQPELRHIPNFQRFLEERPTLVYRDSLEFHSRSLGGLHSVIYQTFGTRTLRFFVRVVNRRENPSLPLHYTHVQALNNACDELTEHTDEYASRVVVKEFEKLATSAIRNITDYKEPLRTCYEALQSIGYGNCALLFKSRTSSTFELVHCGDPQLTKHLKTRLYLASDSPLLSRLASDSGVRITRVSDLRSDTDTWATPLKTASVVSLISSCSAGDGGAILAARCIYEVESKLAPGVQLFLHSSDRDIAPALLSVLGGVIEGSRSNVSADFAEELVAHFGHEVGTPISRLTNKAVAAVNRAIKALRSVEMTDLAAKLDEAKGELYDKGHQITHQMKAAIALADRSNGAIDVKFEQFSWDEIVDSAWAEAVEWRDSFAGRSSERGVVLLKNPAIRKMRTCGDRDLVRAILINLFKNAIKYSTPRSHAQKIGARIGEREDMIVTIWGAPQSYVDIILVGNWGIGIPADRLESIFEKFVRVDRTDRMRAIRGMGLGLYISRLYARIHRGELFCQYSNPTLDDVARTEDLEGYETMMELRLPRDQVVGVHKIKVGP